MALAAALDREATAAGASTCPDNQIILTGVNVVSNGARLDTTGFYSHGSYDLQHGLLSSNVSDYSDGWTGSSVTTDDEYWIVGLSAGTPVDLTATFGVSGSWWVHPGVPQGDVTYQCSLAADADTAGFAWPPGGCCRRDISIALSVTLHRLAQEHFHIRLHLASPQRGGRLDESGWFSFTGLPLGAAVVSCQGYASDPTPVQSSSWGRLKGLYRR